MSPETTIMVAAHMVIGRMCDEKQLRERIHGSEDVEILVDLGIKRFCDREAERELGAEGIQGVRAKIREYIDNHRKHKDD